MAGKTVPANVVIRINDREITNSYKAISAAQSKIERELKGMIIGSDEYVKKSAELKEVQKYFEKIKKEIKGTQEELSGFQQIFAGNVAADFFQNATQKVIEWGQALKERVEQLNEIKGKISQLDAGLSGAGLDRTSARIMAISETYGKGVEEIQVAVKALNAQTGDTNKSLDLIVKGFQAGADASGEMLTQLKEYPTMMNDAKVSAEEMIAIIAQSEKMGVYDDKGIDAIKEGMLRVREGTKATKDALKALEIDVDEVYKKVASGAMSYFDVLKLVSKRISEVGADSRITGTAIADIFGGPGEDAGYRYLSQLQNIDTNLNNLTGSTNEAVIAKNKELEANEKLNGVWVQLTGTASTLSKAYSSVKSGFADVLSYVFKIKESKLSDEYLQQQNRLVFLKSQLDRTNISHEKKLEIFQALKTEFPTYLGGLNLEKMKHEEITKAINETIEALGRKYKAQVFEELTAESSKKFTENYRKAIQARADGEKLIMELQQKYAKSNIFDFNFKSNTTINQLRELQAQYQKVNASVRDNATESAISIMIDKMSKANLASIAADEERIKNQKTLIDLQGKLLPEPFKIPPKTGTSTDTDLDAQAAAAKAAEALRKQQAKDLEDSENDLEKSENDLEKSEKRKQDLKNQYRSEEIALMKEGLQKELAQADFARAQELQKLSANGEEIQAQILKLEKKKLEAKSPVAKANYDKALKEELEARSQNVLLIEKTEQTHQLKLKTIHEKASAQQIETDANQMAKQIENTRRASEQEIINITSLQVAKEKLRNNEFQKMTDQELDAITSLEEAKDALREEANKKMIDQQRLAIEVQIAMLTEALNDPSLSQDAIKKTASNLDFLIDKLHQLEAAKDGKTKSKKEKNKEEDDKVKGQIDILGFSAKDWEDSFTNVDTLSEKLKAAGMIFKALGEAATIFGDLQRAVGERELKNFTRIQKAKKAQLDKNLASGLISQEEYNKRTEAMDIELANKQAEIEYKQAKAEKISKLFSAIGAVALGVASALSLPPPASYILAGITGALGAVQVATIAAQPLPEKPSFAEGGFTGNGFGFPDKTGFKQAGVVHENEWVAPEWMTTHPRISKDIKRLEFMRQNGPSSYADGGYTETTSNSTNTTTATASESNDSLRALFVRLLGIFQKIDDNGGLEAYIVDNPQNQKKVYEMSKKRQSLENKNKH